MTGRLWACPSCLSGLHDCRSNGCVCCAGVNRPRRTTVNDCIVCNRPTRHTFGYHPECEPTTCTCATPRPDGIGECAGCHRLVLSHSWHEGRPARREGAA